MPGSASSITYRYNLRTLRGERVAKKKEGKQLLQWELDYEKILSEPRNFIASEQVMREIKLAFENDAIEQITISLTCPLSKKRIRVPARYKTCRHLQCFDLKTFLEMKSKRNFVVCPICNVTVANELADLHMDNNFNHFASATTESMERRKSSRFTEKQSLPIPKQEPQLKKSRTDQIYFERVLLEIINATEVEISRDGSFRSAHAQSGLIIPKTIDDEEPFVDSVEILSDNAITYNNESVDQMRHTESENCMSEGEEEVGIGEKPVHLNFPTVRLMGTSPKFFTTLILFIKICVLTAPGGIPKVEKPGNVNTNGIGTESTSIIDHRDTHSNNSEVKIAIVGGVKILHNKYDMIVVEVQMDACVYEVDPNHRELADRTSVFFVRAKLNNENWPAFQHFIRLLTDPFIYINCVQLTYQNDVFNLSAEAINSDCIRIQCKELNFDLNADSQKTITWAKNHVRCNQFYIYDKAVLNQDEALLDFFLTGGRCTQSMKIRDYDLSKAVIVLVQNFLDLESRDEYQGVQSIESFQIAKNQDIQVLKNDYAKFLVKEEHDEDDRSTSYVFEFTNNAIGKKLQLLSTVFNDENVDSYSRIPVLSMNIKHV